ncbi:N-acetylmuramoyl-L-alanine amidase family protein [Athalassotoga saccharophila]|uniref:N-acetylmuramoyl-L-alanine amidase family protein n=1 Tax=Athalassotoga saccharophila TaxID=1441386 RepID=UPI0013794DB2|nr:N-acetylmuramoyl-L-alanine amidase [Athalassotoga saccharophila]BBJ28511.1 N-acetylmuramoyl-L-alanine amidase LytC [Athalassotoga saccharophila]
MRKILILFAIFTLSFSAIVMADLTPSATFMNVLKGKIIVLDPGHGGEDTGAIGPTGLLEKTINLEVALDLASILKVQGASVYLTRATDVYVSLQSRIALANNLHADLFLCMHHNSIEGAPDIDRPQAFYWSTTDTSELAAKIILEAFENFTGTEGDLIQEEYYVLRYAQVPAVLIEPFFMSNPTREKWLENPVNIWKEALIYDNGILKYFKTISN